MEQEKLKDWNIKDPLEDVVVGEECEQFDDTVIICVLTLKNGYKVSGSYAHAGEGFLDNALGEAKAREAAMDKVRELENYLKQQRFYEERIEEFEDEDCNEDSNKLPEVELKIDDSIYTSGELQRKLVHYYCPDCGKTYLENVKFDHGSTDSRIQFSTHTWYNCDCGGDAVEIDSRLVDVIVKLNKIGFRTTYCCEGHSFEDTAYIAFEPDVDFTGIELPNLWVSDKSKMVSVVDSNDNTEDVKIFEHEIIRAEFFDKPDKAYQIFGDRFDIFKDVYLNSLYVWVDELETRVLEERAAKARAEACQTSSKSTETDPSTITTVYNDFGI